MECVSHETITFAAFPVFCLKRGHAKDGKRFVLLRGCPYLLCPWCWYFLGAPTLFCGSVYNSSVGDGHPHSCIFGNSQGRPRTDSITSQQEDRRVETEQWKGERIYCLDLGGFYFLVIQELLTTPIMRSWFWIYRVLQQICSRRMCLKLI